MSGSASTVGGRPSVSVRGTPEALSAVRRVGERFARVSTNRLSLLVVRPMLSQADSGLRSAEGGGFKTYALKPSAALIASGDSSTKFNRGVSSQPPLSEPIAYATHFWWA